MIEGPEHIYALQTSDRRFYSFNENLQTSLGANAYFLKYEPSGWDEMSIQNIRNKRYWGIDRSISIPFTYVKDGAGIIKHAFYELGAEADIYLSISRRTLHYKPGVGYGFWYEEIYFGKIDLSTFSHEGEGVTCSTLEDGLVKHLKSNENTKYDYKSDKDFIWVKMDGMNLHNKVETLVVDGTDPDLNYFLGNHTTALEIVSEDAPYVLGKKTTQRVKGSALSISSQNWFMKTSIASRVIFDYDFEVQLSFSGGAPNPSAFYRININRKIPGDTLFSTGATILDIPVSVGPNRFNQVKRVQGTVTLDIPADTEVYLFAFCNVVGAGGDAQLGTTYLMGDNSFFKFTYLYKHPSSFVKFFRPQVLFTKLIESSTDAQFTAVKSSYLTSNSNIVFTSGRLLRGIADSLMQISVSDFFQFFDCFDSVALTEKGKLVDIGDRKSLVDYTKWVDLPEPAYKSVKVGLDNELLFNEVETGYRESGSEIGILNGAEDVHTNMLFSVGTTSSPAKVDKIANINASPYNIERIRVSTFKKDTTDNDMDNEPFVCCISNVLQPAVGADIPEHYLLDRSLNPLASGITETATAFNLFLTPKRNLLRNGPYLKSCTWKMDARVLAFKSSKRNVDLLCDGIQEKQNIAIGDLGEQFFIPLMFNAEFEVNEVISAALDDNPLTVVRFPFQGEYFKGIMKKNDLPPIGSSNKSFSILLLNGNNISKLINYYG